MRALGAIPQVLAFSEVYQAMRQSILSIMSLRVLSVL
jgi:TRAP-type C4-dicarboxylate transport system substrate-binding protein